MERIELLAVVLIGFVAGVVYVASCGGGGGGGSDPNGSGSADSSGSGVTDARAADAAGTASACQQWEIMVHSLNKGEKECNVSPQFTPDGLSDGDPPCVFTIPDGWEPFGFATYNSMLVMIRRCIR